MQERRPSVDVSQFCNGLFPVSPVKNDTSTFTYSARNDFGREVKQLHFCSPKEGFSRCYFENICEIGKMEGFAVTHSTEKYSIYPVRDVKLVTQDGAFLEPTCSDNSGKALDRTKKRIAHLSNHPCVLSKNPTFNGITLGIVATNKLYQRTADGLQKGQKRDSRLYFEGGNTFHLTNKSGIPTYLFGEDSSTITHQILRIDKWFHCQDSSKPGTSYINEQLLYSQYNTLVNRNFMQGEIPKIIKQKAEEISAAMIDDEINAVLLEMKSMGLVLNYQFKTERDKKIGRSIASEYLAQRQFVEKEIFPAELKCNSNQVSFLPQIAYHLDIMITPGPKGSVFLQDYDLAVSVLKAILNKSVELKLSIKEQCQLQSFIQTTTLAGTDLNPLMNKAKLDLEKAGFTVIPTPGVFLSLTSEGEPLNANFMNSLSGFSSKTEHYYYIAPGIKTGGKIGELLMDSYAEFLKHHSSNISVYFAGRKPENDKDFEEATYNLNRKLSQLALHCLSFELKVASHTEL